LGSKMEREGKKRREIRTEIENKSAEFERRSIEEIKGQIREFFNSDTNFIKHVQTLYRPKEKSAVFKSMADFYKKMSENDKLAAGIHHVSGIELIKTHEAEEKRKAEEEQAKL